MERLRNRNLLQVSSEADVPEGSVLILPSHGSPRKVRRQAMKRHIRLIDVMCPYVASVHQICSKIRKDGMKVVIIGDKDHPEVRALVDLAPDAVIINTDDDVRQNAFCGLDMGIISQTTQSREKFFRFINRVIKLNPKVRSIHIYNTICLDTSRRQEDARKLAQEVECMLVIGSRYSANTKRLYNISRRINPKTYLVESENSRVFNSVSNNDIVGIISGASAPEWLVQQIIRKIRKPR